MLGRTRRRPWTSFSWKTPPISLCSQCPGNHDTNQTCNYFDCSSPGLEKSFTSTSELHFMSERWIKAHFYRINVQIEQKIRCPVTQEGQRHLLITAMLEFVSVNLSWPHSISVSYRISWCVTWRERTWLPARNSCSACPPSVQRLVKLLVNAPRSASLPHNGNRWHHQLNTTNQPFAVSPRNNRHWRMRLTADYGRRSDRHQTYFGRNSSQLLQWQRIRCQTFSSTVPVTCGKPLSRDSGAA